MSGPEAGHRRWACRSRYFCEIGLYSGNRRFPGIPPTAPEYKRLCQAVPYSGTARRFWFVKAYFTSGISRFCKGGEEMQKIIQKREAEEKGVAEVRELMHAMLNSDTYTSMQAVGALGAIGAPAVDSLVEALAAADSDARWVVAMALARVGKDAVEPLIEVVQTADEAVMNPAVWALAEIGDPRAVDPLVAELRGGRSECCRALTAAALLKLGDPVGIAEVEGVFNLLGKGFEGLAMEAYEGT